MATCHIAPSVLLDAELYTDAGICYSNCVQHVFVLFAYKILWLVEKSGKLPWHCVVQVHDVIRSALQCERAIILPHKQHAK
jgi:hypothetical protein